MRWHREEYLELMTFGRIDRQMFVELFGPLVGLEDEWRAQGATQEEIELVAFDWDYVPVVGCGGHTGPFGCPETVVLEETADHLLKRDHLGRTVKLCKATATIPLPLDFPVKDMETWLKVKPHYEFREERVDWEQVEAARKAQAEGALVVGNIPGAYNTARELMGEVMACTCYYEHPELMFDILDTLRQTAGKVYERILEKVRLDQLSVHEDFAGKTGPLMSPDQIRMYTKPYFEEVWELAKSQGCRVFQLDSDGDVNPVIDALLECGVNSIIPMEPAAGMDIVAIRKQYKTRLAMHGGIDKHVLRDTKEAIRRELEYKMQPLMQQGGMAFGLDHRIPNGTPLEHYRYYVNTGRELLGLPPIGADMRGWRRMAF